MNTIPLRSPADALPAEGFSVRDLRARWKIGWGKIKSFMHSGELVGVNVASDISGRPQWRFSREAVEKFERRRSSAPAPKPTRRRRQPTVEIDFFPD